MRLKLLWPFWNLDRWLTGCREAAVRKAFYQGSEASEARQRALNVLMIAFHLRGGKRCISVDNGFVLSPREQRDMHGLSPRRWRAAGKDICCTRDTRVIEIMLRLLLGGQWFGTSVVAPSALALRRHYRSLHRLDGQVIER